MVPAEFFQSALELLDNYTPEPNRLLIYMTK